MSRPSAVCVWPCRRSRINSVMRCWVSNTVRRRVSVGCAVITGDTSAPVSASATVAESRSAESSLQVGGGQAAVLRRLARRDMDGAAALPVDVLGDVGQQREMGERADDRDGLVDVDAVEQLRPARRGRSRSGAPGTTPRGPARRGRRPLRRSARGRCRRGWCPATGCPRASVRSLSTASTPAQTPPQATGAATTRGKEERVEAPPRASSARAAARSPCRSRSRQSNAGRRRGSGGAVPPDRRRSPGATRALPSCWLASGLQHVA